MTKFWNPQALSMIYFRPDGPAEVVREGFCDLGPWGFVGMFCRANSCRSSALVNRIEFEYVDGSVRP